MPTAHMCECVFNANIYKKRYNYFDHNPWHPKGRDNLTTNILMVSMITPHVRRF